MSMIEMGMYRHENERPSWQKIERYDYCAQVSARHDGYLSRLYTKLKKIVKA